MNSSHRSLLFDQPCLVALNHLSRPSNLQQEPLILTPRILGGAHPHRASERERGLARQLDKQYWQNVNSVTVDGIGTTQYVIAKDDIGNWQVKSVSNDVSELMETLGGLASFWLGGGISPLAQIEAARIESLVAKARTGSLGASDRDAIEALPAREREVALHSSALESHVDVAVTASLKLIENMRSWKALWAYAGTKRPQGISEDSWTTIGPTLEDAWEPPGAASATEDASARERLRAVRAAFDAVSAYTRSWPAGVERKLQAVEGDARLSDGTIHDLVATLETATDERWASFRDRRSRILDRLRNALEVLAATPVEPR